MTVNTEPVTFDSLNVGDELPPFEIGETQETINLGSSTEESSATRPNIHTNPQFAKEGLFAGTVNSGVTSMAYVAQMLEQWFPASAFYDGGNLSFKAMEPFRPGDIVTFTGKIMGKREEAGRRFVDCQVTGVNQLGKLVAAADATMSIHR